MRLQRKRERQVEGGEIEVKEREERETLSESYRGTDQMRKGKTVADAKMKNAHCTIESLSCLLIFSKKHYGLVQLLENRD